MSTGGLECRLATPADRPGVMALWRAVFGDDDAFIARCLDDFAGQGGVYVAADRASVVANLLAAPCCLGERQGVYLYALATDPGRRAAGVMTRLMAFAEDAATAAGAGFAALIPASPSLFGYYQKRGYEVPVALRFVEWRGDCTDAAFGGGRPVIKQPLTPASLAALRARWLVPGTDVLSFKEAAMAFVCEDLAESGADLLVGPQGYAVALDDPENSRALVPELAAADDTAAQSLTAAVCRLFGRDEAGISLPGASPLWAGRGQTRAAALLKPLGTAPQTRVSAKAPYLRFALDVLPDSFDSQNPPLPG